MDYAYTENASRLMDSTAKAVYHCLTIGESRHGASYWWNKLVRYFQSEPAAQSVEIPCKVNLCGVADGTVTFRRDGSYAISLNHNPA